MPGMKRVPVEPCPFQAAGPQIGEKDVCVFQQPVDGFGPDVHGSLVDELGRIAWGGAAD